MKSWIYKNIFLGVVRPFFHRMGLDLVAYHPPIDKRIVFKEVEPILKKIASFVPEKEPTQGERIIWQFWWQGKDHAPALVKKCMESVHRHSKGWKIVVIDEQNISQYVDIPPYIAEKHRQGVISHTHFSDYLRVRLLQQYGGVWMDATVLLTDDIPDDILAAKVFAFKTSLWASHDDIPQQEMFLTTIQTASNARIGGGECACSNWFLASCRDSALMTTITKALEWYWQDAERVVDYFFFHFLLSYAVVVNEACRKEFVSMPTRINVKPHMLLFKLFDPFDQEQGRQICAASPIHKLTYKWDANFDTKGTFFEAVLSGALTEK